MSSHAAPVASPPGPRHSVLAGIVWCVLFLGAFLHNTPFSTAQSMDNSTDSNATNATDFNSTVFNATNATNQTSANAGGGGAGARALIDCTGWLPANYSAAEPTKETRAVASELLRVFNDTGGIDVLNITDFYHFVRWFVTNKTNATNVTKMNETFVAATNTTNATTMAPVWPAFPSYGWNLTEMTVFKQYEFLFLHLNESGLPLNSTNLTTTDIRTWLYQTREWVLGWRGRCGWENSPVDSTPYCYWSGITCDKNGNITRIDLGANNLRGTATTGLAPFANSSITTLKYLNLSMNLLQGPLPANFGRTWADLKIIDLSRNGLSETLPANFGSTWTKVSHVYLEFNYIIGPIPPEMARFWYVLNVLNISLNQLSGPEPVCQCLGACICV